MPVGRAFGGQRQRQVDRGCRLANPTLPGGNGHNVLDPLYRFQPLLDRVCRHCPAQIYADRLTAAALLLAAIAITSCDAPEKEEDQAASFTNPAPVQSAPMPDPVTRSTTRETALDTLVEAASNPNPLLRANAIEALHAAPGRVEPLTRLALTDNNVGVRFTAAMTIGKLRLTDSADLCRPLLSDPRPEVRAAAIYALDRNGRAVDPTPLAAMLHDDEPRVRANAVFILGELGNPSAIPMIRSAAASEMPLASMAEIKLMRLQVAEALVKLGDKAAIDTIRATLFPSRPEDFEGAALAVQIIGEIQDRRSMTQLIYLAALSGDEKLPAEVRLAAAGALAKMGDTAGSFIADEYVDDPNPAIRAQSAFVYGVTGRPENLSKLQGLMADPQPIVQVAAAAALLQITDQLATQGDTRAQAKTTLASPEDVNYSAAGRLTDQDPPR